jgi:putative addiction module killer protein
VEPKHREIRVYQTEDSQEPFWKWLDRLEDQEAFNRILKRIDRVETGNLGEWDSVGDGVFELVLDFGPGYRVYFGQDGDLVVLLLGGIKKTQERDISKAKEYWRDYNA